MIVGIDPGLDGAIAVLCKGAAPEAAPMPTLGTGRRELDFGFIRSHLHAYHVQGNVHVVIEKQQAMPKQGVSSTGVTMRNYGLIEGVCIGVGIPYTIVPPREWQKVMLSGVSKKLNTKAASILIAKRLYPGVSLRATERCTTDHHGMSDALLIAEYGRRTKGGDAT